MKKIPCLFILILITGISSVRSQDTINKTKTGAQTIEIIAGEEEIVVEGEPAFIVAEENARFQGGDLSEFKEWIQKNLVYPEEAVANGFQGKVIVQFCVSSKGNVVDAKILRGIDPSLDHEALRIVMSSPDWEPAKQGGKPVKQQFVIPVMFSPEEQEK